ncbi:MAG: hypothetical protein QOJ45_278 [Verrucomicrobiota bacterium]|jgi:hypothetical protein
MNDELKRVEDLTAVDLEAFPVWEYANVDQLGETAVRPIKETPVKTMTGRLVGTRIRLANGASFWATVSNVDERNPRLTQHFLTVSVFRNGKWFTMARYHDFDSTERGPEALASFLGLRVDEVFPMSYNISQFCVGESAALVGTIEKEPREKLTRAEIIALAVP